MVDKYIIRKNSYYDSVMLMTITREIESGGNAENAVVVMGTEHNKELLKNIGLYNNEIEDASPSDLIIAVRLMDEDVFDVIVKKVDELLDRKKTGVGGDYCPPTLESAIKSMPEVNMVIISLPGQYAASEAKKALRNEKHVLLFSDNVTIEQEKELKEIAINKGLLMMGPDCGTAVINGIPLAFANVVRRGNIGIVGASGTGTQEVMVQIDKFGGGISQAIGTGGRDLKPEIGGLMMMQGINALSRDDDTKVIVLVSKPPDKEVADKVLKCLEECGKEAVVDFIGGDKEIIKRHGFVLGSTLEDAAYKAVLLSKGERIEDAPLFTLDTRDIEDLVESEASKLSRYQKYLRGLYSGGTLCDETLKLFSKELGCIYSNIPLKPESKLFDSKKGYKHCAIDLGDDEFTVGKPHPMIDSYMRQQMILKQAEDREMAVMLLDIVLGYGSNEDPAGSLTDYIMMAKKKFQERGQYLSVIASICGTNKDPQDYDAQERKLKESGVIVMPSNAQAARLAIKIISRMS